MLNIGRTFLSIAPNSLPASLALNGDVTAICHLALSPQTISFPLSLFVTGYIGSCNHLLSAEYSAYNRLHYNHVWFNMIFSKILSTLDVNWYNILCEVLSTDIHCISLLSFHSADRAEGSDDENYIRGSRRRQLRGRGGREEGWRVGPLSGKCIDWIFGKVTESTINNVNSGLIMFFWWYVLP